MVMDVKIEHTDLFKGYVVVVMKIVFILGCFCCNFFFLCDSQLTFVRRYIMADGDQYTSKNPIFTV